MEVYTYRTVCYIHNPGYEHYNKGKYFISLSVSSPIMHTHIHTSEMRVSITLKGNIRPFEFGGVTI